MMAYCSSTDLDFMDTDLQHEMEKILQGSDKFGFDCFLSGDNSNQQQSNVLDFDGNSNTVDDWIQTMQWSDMSKLNHNSLLDTSFEIENNNPNLLVNPQTVMPIHHMRINNSTMTVNEQNDQISSSPVPKVYTAKIVTPETVHLAQTRNVNNNVIPIPIQTVKVATPSQNSPVLVEHLQNRQGYTQKNITVTVSNSSNLNHYQHEPEQKVYPKPVYSYSCLIAMALKNSRNGSLPVSEIYNFMTEHFPYFKTAPDGWKNSVRHNLSLNKCFAKVETPKMNGNTKKGCLWALNPGKIEKMTEEIAKHRKKDLAAIKSSMSKPEKLELIEAGKAGPIGPPSPQPEEISSPPPTTHIHEISTSRENIAKQNAALQNEINILDGNLTTIDPSLPELTLQNGMWDDLSSEINLELPLSNPSFTNTGLTFNGSPITIQSVVSLSAGNSNLIQGNFTHSPLLSQSSTVTQSSQTPSRVLSATT